MYLKTILSPSSERKKAGDKIYPKGYAEMLEQQQELFVHGLQQMYHQLLAAKLWQGSALCEANEDPLAHDILAALGLLRNEGGEIRRRPSFSSNSDHSHHAPSTSHHTPIVAKTHTFKASVFSNDSPSSFTPSSAPKQGQSRRLDHQSPFHQDNLMINDLDLVWSGRAVPNMSNSEAVATSDFKLQSSELYNSIDDITTKQNLIDSPFSEFEFQNFASNQPQTVNDLHLIQNFECGPWDPTIDLNFENFN